MQTDYSTMPVSELVDLFSQKTQVFTQLLINKRFGQEYRLCKDTIQQIIAEIERRKEVAESDQRLESGQILKDL